MRPFNTKSVDVNIYSLGWRVSGLVSSNIQNDSQSQRQNNLMAILFNILNIVEIGPSEVRATAEQTYVGHYFHCICLGI